MVPTSTTGKRKNTSSYTPTSSAVSQADGLRVNELINAYATSGASSTNNTLFRTRSSVQLALLSIPQKEAGLPSPSRNRAYMVSQLSSNSPSSPRPVNFSAIFACSESMVRSVCEPIEARLRQRWKSDVLRLSPRASLACSQCPGDGG